MAKKKSDEEVVETVAETPTELLPIAPINVEFGREDLNLMRDTINQLIARQ